MKTYICKKPFDIEKHDEDGFFTGKYLTVSKGNRFQSSDGKFRCVGAADTVRLDSKDGTWLEISRETLDEHFEEAPNE